MSYRLTLSQEALDFWHALWAPFQDYELSEVPRGSKETLAHRTRMVDGALEA